MSDMSTGQDVKRHSLENFGKQEKRRMEMKSPFLTLEKYGLAMLPVIGTPSVSLIVTRI